MSLSGALVCWAASVYWDARVLRRFRTELYETKPISALPDAGRFGAPIFFSAPRQGFSRTFRSAQELVDWLEETRAAWTHFAEELAETPLEILHEHAERCANLCRDIASDVLRNTFASLKAYEAACQQEKIAVYGGNVAQYLFDASFLLSNRAFAASTFVDAAGIGTLFNNKADDDLPLAAEPLRVNFSEHYPTFRAMGGDAQVLYDMTVRALGSQMEGALQLERQRRHMEQYLEAARVAAQLGPAAARWRAKARAHRIGAIVGIAPFIIILVAPIVFHKEIAAALSALWTMDKDTEAHLRAWSEILAKAPIAAAVFVTVPALLFGWVLKHFSRLYMQNLALAADAGRRAAMADVYARMIAERGAFAPEHQTIVIQSLFAPGEAIKDSEAIPANVIEQMLQLAKGKPH